MWHQLTSLDAVWPFAHDTGMDEQPYLTARETAERLGISLRTVRRRIADGSLASIKIGGAVRIPASALELPEARASMAAREAAVSYGSETEAEEKERYIRRWNREHWPDSWERMLGRRRQAFAELGRLSKLTKPPSGPHDTVDAMLAQEREEFGARLMQFIPEAREDPR
jgi:excisionase family DNA binding protein